MIVLFNSIKFHLSPLSEKILANRVATTSGVSELQKTAALESFSTFANGIRTMQFERFSSKFWTLTAAKEF